jgi:hypothetical protein
MRAVVALAGSYILAIILTRALTLALALAPYSHLPNACAPYLHSHNAHTHALVLAQRTRLAGPSVHKVIHCRAALKSGMKHLPHHLGLPSNLQHNYIEFSVVD